ncbi:hypothetical protein ACOMHN_019135 [Nucella lapillus]
MCENRAAKSGFALEAQKKMQVKYDQDKASQCMSWVSRAIADPTLDTSGTAESVIRELCDGVVLHRLYSAIDPKYKFNPEKAQKKTLPFQKMERIESFNQKIKGPPLSISQYSCFTTPDLYEGMNAWQVITCLETVARRCLVIDTPVEGYGPKEAEANKREFSEEQLAQGKTVIGLQMGSNKGASQAGQNFGKTRMIVD